MCTSMALPTPDGRHLFGRTLDLDTHFGERVVLTPRRFPLCFTDCYPQTHHYALLGMAAVAKGYPLYAEAMNEKGLCMAGLRFADHAAYAPRPREGWVNLAPRELIPYLLGHCATLPEARAALRDVCVVDVPVSEDMPAAPLHWHLADADPSHGGLIVEVTEEGMRLYDDPTDGMGVLTNAPPYPTQRRRLANSSAARGDVAELPGDYTSTSRFVRGAALRRLAVAGMGAVGEDHGGGDAAVAHFFRLLGAVSPPIGAVTTPDGGLHRTLYTCCMDTRLGVYRYTTEEEATVRRVSFGESDVGGDTLVFLS